MSRNDDFGTGATDHTRFDYPDTGEANSYRVVVPHLATNNTMSVESAGFIADLNDKQGKDGFPISGDSMTIRKKRLSDIRNIRMRPKK